VASALSLGAVGLSRGVTGTVHSYSFVDLEADSHEARSTAYFGYKSNRRQRVDLSLPSEQEGYLRGLSTGAEVSQAYATPERYAAITGQATLAGTPMRATLKQFEGFWEGSLAGTIRGSLIADRATGKLTAESWLENDLGVAFARGYLLYIDPRMSERDGGVPYRVAGLDRRAAFKAYYGSETVAPAVNVLALAIPPLAPGQRVDRLGTHADAPYNDYGKYDRDHSNWERRPQPDPTKEPMLPTLRHRQLEEWVNSFGTMRLSKPSELCDAAALLASTRNLHLHNDDLQKFDTVGRPLSTMGLTDEDVTHWLTRGQAVLLLLSDEPGPAQLHLNGRPKESKEGRSLYRVRIPIRYAGRP
jgi:hypothetical protein